MFCGTDFLTSDSCVRHEFQVSLINPGNNQAALHLFSRFIRTHTRSRTCARIYFTMTPFSQLTRQAGHVGAAVGQRLLHVLVARCVFCYN